MPQPFRWQLYWTIITGYLRGELSECLQEITEFGLVYLWERIGPQFHSSSSWNRHTVHAGTSEEEATPITLDFEIMNIFPFCGYLLVCSAILFLLELAWKGLENLNRFYLEIIGLAY